MTILLITSCDPAPEKWIARRFKKVGHAVICVSLDSLSTIDFQRISGAEVCILDPGDSNPIETFARLLSAPALDKLKKIVALEANGDPGLEKQLLLAGAETVLNKKFLTKRLISEIEEIVSYSPETILTTPLSFAKQTIRFGVLKQSHLLLGKKIIALSAVERKLLSVLNARPNSIVSLDEIGSQFLGFTQFSENNVRAAIGRLRRKLKGTRIRIRTHSGIGYSLLAPPRNASERSKNATRTTRCVRAISS